MSFYNSPNDHNWYLSLSSIIYFLFFLPLVISSVGSRSLPAIVTKTLFLPSSILSFLSFILISDTGKPRGRGKERWTLVQRSTSSHPQQSMGKSVYRLRERATCRNSTVSSDSHLEIDLHGLDCTVNLQFQGQFVPISLRPVLGIVAACIIAEDCLSWGVCALSLTDFAALFYLTS